MRIIKIRFRFDVDFSIQIIKIRFGFDVYTII